MRDPDRIPRIMASITMYWKEHPDLRLGQLIENMRTAAPSQRQMYFIEDEELIEGFVAMAQIA